MTAQNRPVGKLPSAAELLVGALMAGSVADALSVLRFVEDTDLEQPGATVLASVRSLVLRGSPPGPQLVHDDLQRRGKLTRSSGTWLSSAITSGACSLAAPDYASAVVAQRFRAQVESLGHALISTSATASEADVALMVERTAEGIRGTGARLADLRGDS